MKSQKAIYNLGKFTDFIVDKVAKAQDGLPKKDVGKRILNLLFEEGDEPPRPTVDPKARYWFDNFYYYQEIICSFERLYQAYGYLQKYPKLRYYSFYSINELNWIRYHIEFFFQQNYIMHQHTLKWIDYLLTRARHKPDKKVIETRLMELKKAVDKAFKSINRIRGQHVHQYTFEEKDFVRAEMAMSLTSLLKEKKFAVVTNIVLAKIATEWRKKFLDNTLSMIKSYDLILGALGKIINDLE